jgi:hypothetical protein
VLCGFATGEHARLVERMHSDELCSLAERLLRAVPEFGRW